MNEINELNYVDESSIKPRLYQEQMLEQAMKENVIIYLPTGSGKTFIALMVLRRMSDKLNGSLTEGGKRTVFLTNTVALAKQQYEVIKKFTSFKVRLYTGDLNVDNWKRDRWEEELNKFQVFVSTTQIILDVVRHKHISINQFNLIIFDECHHATKGHAMLQLMAQFADANPKNLPRVIGLTGILIKTSSNIIEELSNLEAVFRSKIITSSNLDDYNNILLYSTKPEELVLLYNDIKVHEPLIPRIEHMILECISIFTKLKIEHNQFKLTKNMNSYRLINPIKKMESLLKDALYQITDLGLYGGRIAFLSVLIEIEMKKRRSDTIAYRNLCRLIISYVEYVLHLINSKLYDSEDDNELDIMFNNSTAKVLKLLLFLRTEFVSKNAGEIKCLVFVERRHTAKNLYHLIKSFVKEEQDLNIRPNFMIGSHDLLPESIEYILESKYNRNVLKDFEKNECNLIVASSVLEEGIDLQSCNYVVIFDELKSFVSYIQTKGRARMQNSKYCVLMGLSKKNRLLANIRKYGEIDKELKNYLINKAVDRKPPSIFETDKQFEICIPPFFTNIGAKLEAESCVSLLNKYCSQLPNDSYTVTAPQYSKVETSTSTTKIVKLILPMQSTIKDDIISDEMPNIKWAKRSAAFKACKMLYDNNELNNHLLPISKRECLEYIQPVYFEEWAHYSNDDKLIAGTKKNRRMYDVYFPEKICCSMPKLGDVSYLYTIHIKTKFDRNDENKHVFDSLQNNTSGYALLSRWKLPKIAPMPLFMSQGQVIAYLSNFVIEVTICNKEDYQKLRNFNTMIFKDLIKDSWSKYFAQDYRNMENSYIIVPVNDDEEINWQLVENFQNLTNVTQTTEAQRSKMNIKAEDYINNLITTWYTMDNSTRYIVTQIRDDLTPLSQFPKEPYGTFETYVKDKWNQTIVQRNSFLLEVEPFTSRINFFTYNEEKKKNKRFHKILLIPELVHNFRFPAHLYLKARFLPCILFRLHYILIAEELRLSLNSVVNICSENYNPLPLIVDKTLQRVKKNDTSKDNFKLFDDELCEVKKLRTVESNMQNFYDWKEHEEPCDLVRHMETLYKIELDYYYFFVTKALDKLNLNDNSEQFSAINPSKCNANKNVLLDLKNSICDVELSEKSYIHLLNINESSMKGPEQWELVSSITAAAANDVFDSERLEVLGDSFLKFSISLWLLHRHPHWNEGYLTEVKSQFVSNRNLLYQAIKKNFPGRLYCKSFKPTHEWKPPSISIPLNAEKFVGLITPSVFNELELNEHEIICGECEQETLTNFERKFKNYEDYLTESDTAFLINKTWISDKVVADAIEAILGVCVKNYGIKKSFLMLEYFGICPKTRNLEDLLNLNLGNPRLKTNISDQEVDAFLLNYNELENNLGYQFKDRAYLLQALTHPSYPTNRITGCYQQLEFIGDAVLDFLVTSYIFEKCGYMDPGKLTDLRSALVNNVTLACLSVRHKFHLFLLSQNAVLSQSIMKFVEFQEQNNFKITDQVRILALEHEIQSTMADYINVPKTLGDLFEALVGAIFLDSGNNLKKVWDVIFNLMSVEIFEFMANVPIHIVRQLYEYHGADPIFEAPVIENEIVMMKCAFTCRNERIEVFGFGTNQKEAKVSAAKSALQHLMNS